MNYNLSILVAFVFLLLTTAAERLSDYHVRNLNAQHAVLTERLKKLGDRAAAAATERKKYEEAEAVTGEIQSQMTRQGDSASVIQWLDDNSANLGVVLVSTKVAAAERAAEAAGYRRIRMDVHLRGAYFGLLRYVESVERSSIPMLIDSFTLLSVRETPGGGDLTLNLSCLFPTPTAKSPRTGGKP